MKVDVIIACAMEEEAAPFREVTAFSGSGPWVGKIGGLDVGLVVSGIGLVNAAMAAADQHLDTDLYLVAGTCGGLAQQIRVGDVVAGTFASYLHADATAFGYELGQIPGMPARYESTRAQHMIPADHAGLVLSGNSFVTEDNVEQTREDFPLALAVDMETTAVAQVCYRRGWDWLSLRAVSDLCGPRAGEDFHIELNVAAEKSRDAVVAYLEEL
ncbi:5'-methylthioadenosine/S-adenosylhomocysteine nucleosidase [Scrofimicrobium canadense]|nr:5'-methylthioadenosine/S-adenosylhomocysteine nucleosidase [Scrofimicrobium canadense]